MIFQGIRTSIAKKPYIFVIFQGGGSELPVLHLDPHMCTNICNVMYLYTVLVLTGVEVKQEPVDHGYPDSTSTVSSSR